MNHPVIEPEHVLATLVALRDGIVPGVVRKLGVDQTSVTNGLQTELGKRPQPHGGAQPSLSPRLAAVERMAEAEAEHLKDECVSTEHLLIALADEGDRSPSARLLKQHRVTRDGIFQALTAVRGSQRVTDQNPEGKYQALERYGRDLTDPARHNKLDPVIGRDEEIRRVVQVLARRTKNNPVLIGEPGIDRTTIGKGLAQRIVRGDVPEGLKNKRIVGLDMGRSWPARNTEASSKNGSRLC